MPELPVINMFAEEAPTEERGIALQSRPGLGDREADMGAGPVRQLFQRDGVLSGALFGVSGGSIYSGTTALGSIGGSGPVSIAGNEIGIIATAGGTAHYYDGSALSSVSFPDSADVRKVFQGGSRFWLIRDGTGKLYFTPALDATVDSLDFVTAESMPDSLLDGLWLDDTAILFGAESVEFWPNTSDDELPIQPLEGRVIEKGIKATGCAAVIGSTFAWVTNGNQVCLTDENTIISNPGLEEKIEASSECRLFTFVIGGIDFLGLRIDGETHAWSWRSKLWSEFKSYGEANWVPQCFAGGVFGSAVDGRTLAWSSGHEDLGGVLERRFRAGFWATAAMFVSNLVLRCNVGQTPFLEGDYAEPVVEMRVSLDHGRTWGDWRSASLGAQGQYGISVPWRAIGMARRWKAFLAEFRVTAPIDFRVSDVLANEPYGGR